MARRKFEALGMTLLELMVVIAIVAILLAIATPSMQSMIQRNRIAAEVNSLIGDLQYARSEAIKRGQPVSVCVSSDGSSCSGANTWDRGWIVFLDVNGLGAMNPAPVPLRRRPNWASNDTFVPDAALAAVTYNRDGFATNLPAPTVTLALHSTPANGQATRCVALNIVGRQALQSAGQGACK